MRASLAPPLDPPLVTLISGTFNLSDGHSDGENGMHTHFSRQRNRKHNGIIRCEQTLIRHFHET